MRMKPSQWKALITDRERQAIRLAKKKASPHRREVMKQNEADWRPGWREYVRVSSCIAGIAIAICIGFEAVSRIDQPTVRVRAADITCDYCGNASIYGVKYHGAIPEGGSAYCCQDCLGREFDGGAAKP